MNRQKQKTMSIVMIVLILTGLTVPSISGDAGHEIVLYAGWNLIGLPSTPTDPCIEVVLADILDKVISVWTYDGDTKIWSSYSPYAPSDLHEMVDGKGYWIRMTEDTVLTVFVEGYGLRDPTILEVYDFMVNDRTDENEYIEGEYDVVNFVADFKQNAIDAGYISYMVYIKAVGNSTNYYFYAVAFNTTDRGMVYIDVWFDEFIEPVVGNALFSYLKDIIIIKIVIIP